MAEWVGPQRISQPNAWPHSITRSRCATAAARIFGSGEIGLVSGPITVTAVAPRPRLLIRLPSRSNGARSAVSKIGTSTASKPSALIWSRIASCCSVTWVVHNSRFMPIFMDLRSLGSGSLPEEVLTIEQRDQVQARCTPTRAPAASRKSPATIDSSLRRARTSRVDPLPAVRA